MSHDLLRAQAEAEKLRDNFPSVVAPHYNEVMLKLSYIYIKNNITQETGLKLLISRT